MRAAQTPLELPPKPTSRVRVALIVTAVIAFTVATCVPAIGGVTLDFGAIIRNWNNGSSLLAQMFRPDFTFLPRTIQPMIETLEMALIGAVLAAIVSVPLTLWAASASNPNAVTRRVVRAVINVIRAVPDLVYATILVAMLGVGALPGLITLFLFNVGVVVKLVSEAIDSADHSYMEAGRAAGGTQSQINRATTLAQSLPLFANQWLYALELNVRISAILGLVGAGGIGRLLNERRAFYAYNDVAVIVLEILVVVVLIEIASNVLRKRLV
jgi:phosphonate transport system permease protein